MGNFQTGEQGWVPLFPVREGARSQSSYLQVSECKYNIVLPLRYNRQLPQRFLHLQETQRVCFLQGGIRNVCLADVFPPFIVA